jgi:hypothetical protein
MRTKFSPSPAARHSRKQASKSQKIHPSPASILSLSFAASVTLLFSSFALSGGANGTCAAPQILTSQLPVTLKATVVNFVLSKTSAEQASPSVSLLF